MKEARRDHLISSAQVAFYYGHYGLSDAMTLSKEERQLLLGVVMAEEERIMGRLEQALGIAWDIQDLLEAVDVVKGEKKTKSVLPTRIRIPALLALAPEAMKAMAESINKERLAEIKRRREAGVGGTTPVVEMGNLSAADFKKLWSSLPIPSTPVDEAKGGS